MGSGQEPRIERVGILPLRNSVLFPMSVVPINVGRPRSVRLVEELANRERALVGVLAQRSADTVEPAFGDVFEVGTLARVVKVIRLGPTNYSVVLNGLCRFRVHRAIGLEPFMQAEVTRIRESRESSPELNALTEQLRERTREVLELTPELPKETGAILQNVAEPGALADLIASNFTEEQAQVVERQAALEALEPLDRASQVLALVERQLHLLKTKNAIASELQDEVALSQREYVLREQMKSILEELGESPEDDEVDELRGRIMRADLPKVALEAARKQLSRLRSMQPQSAEYGVARNYVEWLADLPWSRTTPELNSAASVRRCLDEDHHGLETVKKRIVEFSAVRQLRRDQRSPILLFVGPPGVGKTSLGRSIARATGRRHGRISLGGVRDEAEIRGHRRTYVGALPGRIIQTLKKLGTRNPLIVLDEVDKLASDMRGDPSSALLEVLDPAQNDTFIDHYIGLPFDLSQVIFLATANERFRIPAPLRDRLEIIEVPGYTRSEKLAIAEQFLLPKQLREHGLTGEMLEFDPEGVEVIVDEYTREAGVRSLERRVADVCRHVAVTWVEAPVTAPQPKRIADPAFVRQALGPRKYTSEIMEDRFVPGVATGLGSSSAGGDLLLIEVTRMPGKGEIRVSGSLQTVMKESAMTAVSFVRSHAREFELDPQWLESIDLHLHVPRARAARDAAGASVPMFVAVVSQLLGVPTLPNVAATGELTLRGRILPINDVKAKVLAAHRAGIKRVLLPERNRPDVEEIPREIRQELDLRFISHAREVLELVLDMSVAPSMAIGA